jgi:hypothetical protein
VSRIFDQPLFGLVDHLHELADYFFIRIINVQKLLLGEIVMSKREFQMNLRFGGFTFRITQFCNKRGFVAALPPGLGNVCANRTRRPADSISQCITFFDGKFFAQVLSA